MWVEGIWKKKTLAPYKKGGRKSSNVLVNGHVCVLMQSTFKLIWWWWRVACDGLSTKIYNSFVVANCQCVLLTNYNGLAGVFKRNPTIR